ncbi:hypothetical protein CDAR_434551 [Caerostris darwini]|uniref:Uncharacterized protein n=1 Tax=Caerostris darwini TaxID=1538125 RepID=A0AAV4PHF8_9ARAC|nr:hypothetical protein CDAR_434551 [Caerostris darwini]
MVITPSFDEPPKSHPELGFALLLPEKPPLAFLLHGIPPTVLANYAHLMRIRCIEDAPSIVEAYASVSNDEWKRFTNIAYCISMSKQPRVDESSIRKVKPGIFDSIMNFTIIIIWKF